MIFRHDEDIIDIDLPLTLSVLRLLDEQMDMVTTQAEDFGHFESTGFYDELEHLLAFGIVGVQTYLTDMASFAGLSKHETFKYGDKTNSGTSKVQIINAVANYWKHRSEWVLDGGGKRKEAIDKLFEEVGYTTGIDYPVSGVITELLAPLDTRLFNLNGILVRWRNEMFSDPDIPTNKTNKAEMATPRKPSD